MADHAIDAVVISSTDPHQSELPPAHWRGREWLTGFASENGTSGTAVVTADQAYVWTDNRYFIQATEQLQGTGFSMMPEDGPNAVNLIDWLVEHLNSGQTVGIDGMTFSVSYAQRLEQELNDNGMKLNDNFNVFEYIYPDRPERPKNKIFIHDEKIVGQDVNQKMDAINAEVKAELANAVLLSALDDIAWATNLRAANDIPFSPVYLSFLYVSPTERVLFVAGDTLTTEV
ncbi:MAG: aminopeptidase P family N-terminal domain-containing protein [Muribaculaceae bacterium]|nr:aminopeptidase P family N-terminal domain-containing protein [Muribaculaceae bacterium]